MIMSDNSINNKLLSCAASDNDICAVAVIVDDNDDGGRRRRRDVGGGRRRSNSSLSSSLSNSNYYYLTYQDAQHAMNEHYNNMLLQIAVDSTDTTTATSGDADDNHVIIVAYLASNNSLDYFLSVLSCLCLKHHPSSSSTSSSTTSSTSTTKGKNNYNVIKFVPALINTRWSVQEMAAALLMLLQSDHSQTHQQMMVLCYTSEFQSTAQQLKALILSQTTTTLLQLVPIPSFAQRKIVRGTTSETIMRNQQPSCRRRRTTSATSATSTADQSSSRQHERIIEEEIRRISSNTSSSRRRDDDIIFFTSGTSGSNTSKGVRLSYEALYVQALAKRLQPCNYSRQTQLPASTVPFYHVGGFSSILAVWLAGGCVHIPAISASMSSSTTSVSSSSATYNTNSSFNPKQVLRMISVSSSSNNNNDCVDGARTIQPPATPVIANTLVVVPAMLYALKEEIEKQKDNYQRKRQMCFPHIQLILIGGQSVSNELLEYCRFKVFPNAKFVQTYACTEAASSLTFLDITNTTNSSSSSIAQLQRMQTMPSQQLVPSGDCVGKPPKHIEIRLFDKEQAIQHQQDKNRHRNRRVEISQPYRVGIIATRGPHVMNGYWNQQQQQQQQHCNIDGDWMLTGDLGYFDLDGNLYFYSRVSDSIRTGGETVLAPEVERVLLRHRLIEECAVFGLPHDKYGEIVCCAIVPVGKSSVESLSVQDIREWCRQQHLAGYKCPKRMYFIDELPKTSLGKVSKRKLAELFGNRNNHQKQGSVLPRSKL